MSITDNYLISVIIPTYNRVKALKKNLNAFNDQVNESHPFEVIIVDDGSTDGTLDYLKNETQNISFPLRFTSQKQKGPAAARNVALNQAKGTIALFLNDDCIPAPDLLSQHQRYHQQFGECTVLGNIKWSEEIDLSPEVKELIEKYYFPYYQIIDRADVNFTYFITGNLSTPIKRVLDEGGYDETFRQAAFEDIELGYRLQKKGLIMRYNAEAVAYHYHPLTFDDLCNRQKMVAYWLFAFLAKHPEAIKFYPGLENFNGVFPIRKKECMELILRYESYKGLKEGNMQFFIS